MAQYSLLMSRWLFLLAGIALPLSGFPAGKEKRPNVILILADDMGMECLGSYGGLSYRTPVLDSLAANGIRFANCMSQPLCTPSRVELMTGFYNYQNYDYWGNLRKGEYTFGHLMKEAGYATCIAGKWQLNGAHNKDKVPDWNDNSKPFSFGFDEFCLWQVAQRKNEGDRYAKPLIVQNGKYLDTSADDYGPDIFSNYVLDFIDRKKDGPFFVYYPMVLVHEPFVPTPDSDAWRDPSRRYEKDTTYFRDMVGYADKLVGRLTRHLEALGLDKNTIILFAGDNGTGRSVYTQTANGIVRGGKGLTTAAGTHVPLIAYWPGKIRNGKVYSKLVDFTDFVPTLADLAGVGQPSGLPGLSFYPLLTGDPGFEGRITASCHFDQDPLGKDKIYERARFVRTVHYKLYHDGRFYNISKDILEKDPLKKDRLSGPEKDTLRLLEQTMRKHPVWVEKQVFSQSGNDMPWASHSLDPNPASGSDGVKMADVNGDGFPDLVTGFEEDGVSRIYLNPGHDQVKKQYWKYVELPSPDVEDALLVDLDNNGITDLVTASEGATNQIMFHWAPDDPADYLDASKWVTQTVPAVKGLSAWMFAVSADMDRQHGMDLVIGSKRRQGDSGDDKAVIGWLKCPADPRDVSQWSFHPLSRAGWTMSVILHDMNGDGLEDILVSDRRNSTQTGVRWLENPGVSSPRFYSEWKSHLIGTGIKEPMFLSIYDLNGDGLEDILVPDLYNGLVLLEQSPDHSWKTHRVPYPGWAGPRGKSVAVSDTDLDGRPDIVLSFEEEADVARIPYTEYRKTGKYSVVGIRYEGGNPFTGEWTFYRISDLRGRKFDLVNLLDMDGDGDQDVLTNDENEEDIGMGVIWYENPAIRP